MVLKAHDASELGLEGEVAYHALLGTLGGEVEHVHARAADARGRVVVVAHELIAAADAEEGGPVLGCGADVRALAATQVLQQQALLKVLAAADEEEVKAAQRPALAYRQLRYRAAYAAPLQALFYAQHVAPVAVEVQHIGVEVANTQLHHFQNSFLPQRAASAARRGSIAV